MLFATVIRSTTAVTTIGFYGFGVFYSIERVLVLGHFDTLARSVIDIKHALVHPVGV
jgi:hypothetical protein